MRSASECIHSFLLGRADDSGRRLIAGLVGRGRNTAQIGGEASTDPPKGWRVSAAPKG